MICWTTELAIRDLKGHFGLADYQCYFTTAIHRFVHLACLAFCLYRLIQLKEDTRAWLPHVRVRGCPAHRRLSGSFNPFFGLSRLRF